MKTLYLDLIGGISGDMFLGALLDLGVEFPKLVRELKKLDLTGYQLDAIRDNRMGIEGVKFDVHVDNQGHTHPHPHHEHHSHSHSHSETDPESSTHDSSAHEEAHDPPHHSHESGEEHSHPSPDSKSCCEEHSHGEHEDHRDFAEIQKLIVESRLSTGVKERAVAIFRRIAVAEGKIHGVPPDQVHFHEVGGLDSIVDVVGACVALEMLGNPRVLAAPVVDGTGFIECAHGRFPIPAPASLELLTARGIAITQCEEPHEMVTPTGAALLAELVEEFGPMAGLAVERIGYGLGSRDHITRPNLLRALLGTAGKAATVSSHDWESDMVVTLQTNLDDTNPELLGGFLENALAAGALDVFHTPIQMKKNRPGVLLTVLCLESDADRFAEKLFRETTAFGIRRSTMERRKLRREIRQVQTPYGTVSVKVGLLDGHVIQVSPEFESCKSLAAQSGVPLKSIYEAASHHHPDKN